VYLRSVTRFVLESGFKLLMADRSQSKDDFLGLYIRSEMKERARQRAEEQGISLSEFVRRQLDHLDDAAEQQAVTA